MEDKVLESLESGQGLPQINTNDNTITSGLTSEQRGLEIGLTHEQFTWKDKKHNNDD